MTPVARQFSLRHAASVSGTVMFGEEQREQSDIFLRRDTRRRGDGSQDQGDVPSGVSLDFQCNYRYINDLALLALLSAFPNLLLSKIVLR